MAKELEERTLYVRGLNEPAEENEDIWDDTILNTAYDRALKLANEEVAKRIAMETNTKGKAVKSKSAQVKSKGNKQIPSKSTPSQSEKVDWKAGMPCRAVYEDDGLEYEAFLIKIISDEECIVKFLGYENSERVTINSLKPTLGDEIRMRQVEAALDERDDDGFESQPVSENIDASSDGDVSTRTPARASYKKKKDNEKSKNRGGFGSDFGDLPQLPMPSMNMFRNMGSIDGPMHMPPPPPLVTLSDRSDAEEQAISDMLLSWYMTGYYTGLYQGMKRQRQSRRNNN